MTKLIAHQCRNLSVFQQKLSSFSSPSGTSTPMSRNDSAAWAIRASSASGQCTTLGLLHSYTFRTCSRHACMPDCHCLCKQNCEHASSELGPVVSCRCCLLWQILSGSTQDYSSGQDCQSSVNLQVVAFHLSSLQQVLPEEV